MTRDEILNMAREAGIFLCSDPMDQSEKASLVRFADLVATAERERCAARQDERAKKYAKEGMIVHIIEMCAEDIRAMSPEVRP